MSNELELEQLGQYLWDNFNSEAQSGDLDGKTTAYTIMKIIEGLAAEVKQLKEALDAARNILDAKNK